MCHRIKFRQNRPNSFDDITIFPFQDGRRPPSWILKCLVTRQVERAKMHHHIKFHQNQSNGCIDIAFNILTAN